MPTRYNINGTGKNLSADHSLDKAPHHDDVSWSRGIAPPFVTWALDGGEWSASRPCHFTAGGKSLQYPLYRRLDGLQSRSRRCEELKTLFPLPGTEPQSLGCPAHSPSLCRDIPALRITNVPTKTVTQVSHCKSYGTTQFRGTGHASACISGSQDEQLI
jgi:hypothetical protein